MKELDGKVEEYSKIKKNRENMYWPYILCAAVLGWGIYWSLPHGK